MNPFIRLHPSDDVVIARSQLVGGTPVEGITARGLIPAGHKIAARAIALGEPVRRYNQIIGFASKPIAAGEHVHTQNLWVGEGKGDFARDYAIGVDLKPEPAHREASFMGYQRSDGRVATRNYIGVLSSVNCSATAARAIADHFSRQNHPEALADFPNVDGVVALTHGSGCGMDSEGLGLKVLQRTLAGVAANLPSLQSAGLHWSEIQVLLVLDGRAKASLSMLDTLSRLGLYDPALLQEQHGGRPVHLHLFERTIELQRSATVRVGGHSEGRMHAPRV